MQEVYNFNAINNSEIRFRYIILTCLCGRKLSGSLNSGERGSRVREPTSPRNPRQIIYIDGHSSIEGRVVMSVTRC